MVCGVRAGTGCCTGTHTPVPLCHATVLCLLCHPVSTQLPQVGHPAVELHFFELFVPRDSVDDLKPALSTLGPLKYSYYIIMLVLLYCLVFYSLELFNFFNLQEWALCVVGSAAITLLLIYTFEFAKCR